MSELYGKETELSIAWSRKRNTINFTVRVCITISEGDTLAGRINSVQPLFLALLVEPRVLLL